MNQEQRKDIEKTANKFRQRVLTTRILDTASSGFKVIGNYREAVIIENEAHQVAMGIPDPKVKGNFVGVPIGLDKGYERLRKTLHDKYQVSL